METVTLSPQYQIVIPQSIRKSLRIQPGQKLRLILYDNRLELIPIETNTNARGMLRGIDTNVER